MSRILLTDVSVSVVPANYLVNNVTWLKKTTTLIATTNHPKIDLSLRPSIKVEMYEPKNIHAIAINEIIAMK